MLCDVCVCVLLVLLLLVISYVIDCVCAFVGCFGLACVCCFVVLGCVVDR